AASLQDDFSEHLGADEIVAHADLSASNEERARATEHLACCDMCRRELADLRASITRGAGKRAWAWRRLGAVAAVMLLAIVITAAIALRREPPAQRRVIPPVDRSPSARDLLVAAALRDGIAKPAVLVALAQPGQAMRGVGSDEQPKVIEPVGIVVDDTRPRFRWSGTGDAAVNVSILSQASTVATSVTLHGNEWKPAQALERGRIYRWQIEVTTTKDVMIAPRPSDPPALFTVLSDDEHRALEAARVRFANDDLYLGVLTARDGLQGEAAEHLRRYSAAHPEEKTAATLLREVEAWRARQ
ncbi:MAG TPA: hypothetical protein VF713_21010, partial [Thermoanaerobaculia bacterium]